MTSNSPARQQERIARSAEQPLVSGLPNAPGIVAAMQLSPELGSNLRALADTLLVHPFPESSLTRFESELIATRVSAANNCFFCMDSHAKHAEAIAECEGIDRAEAMTEAIKVGSSEELSPKLTGLLRVALNVQGLVQDNEQETQAVQSALEAGATPGDIHHTVAIAAAFSMYNRLVEGFRAMTPSNTGVYDERAAQIAQHGYQLPLQ
jgi:AhpD family alkylhydroperoxidase